MTEPANRTITSLTGEWKVVGPLLWVDEFPAIVRALEEEGHLPFRSTSSSGSVEMRGGAVIMEIRGWRTEVSWFIRTIGILPIEEVGEIEASGVVAEAEAIAREAGRGGTAG